MYKYEIVRMNLKKKMLLDHIYCYAGYVTGKINIFDNW